MWDPYQLHGDIGERLGLTRKRSPAEFTTLCATPGSEVHVAAGTNDRTWCLGDVCLKDYRFPPDWDVLGQLPPITAHIKMPSPKPQKLELSTNFTAINEKNKVTLSWATRALHPHVPSPSTRLLSPIVT